MVLPPATGPSAEPMCEKCTIYPFLGFPAIGVAARRDFLRRAVVDVPRSNGVSQAATGASSCSAAQSTAWTPQWPRCCFRRSSKGCPRTASYSSLAACTIFHNICTDPAGCSSSSASSASSKPRMPALYHSRAWWSRPCGASNLLYSNGAALPRAERLPKQHRLRGQRRVRSRRLSARLVPVLLSAR